MLHRVIFITVIIVKIFHSVFFASKKHRKATKVTKTDIQRIRTERNSIKIYIGKVAIPFLFISLNRPTTRNWNLLENSFGENCKKTSTNEWIGGYEWKAQRVREMKMCYNRVIITLCDKTTVPIHSFRESFVSFAVFAFLQENKWT